MKRNFRTAAFATMALGALALTACSSGEGVPGVVGLGAEAQGPTNVQVPTSAPEPIAPAPTAAPTAPTEAVQTPTPGPQPTLDLGDASSSAPATTAAPSGDPANPQPTESNKAYGVLRTNDKNKYIDSKVPFLAGIVTPEGKVVHFYRFERMDIDFKCTASDAVAPQNGHFVRVFYMLSNSKTPKGGPNIDVTEKTWQYLGKDGKPYGGNIVTNAAKSCLKKSPDDDGQWGGVAKPGWLVGGELIFDLPSTDGTLQQTYQPGLGGWRFPVENANTNFISLDERAAERFNSLP